METPKIFISYSHDSEEHKNWVLKLAENLIYKGIDCILDQWDLTLGSNLPKFMESGLEGSDRVLVVCTNEYNEKANNGVGGVGYENTIITSELMINLDSNKFIPIIRDVDKKIKTPLCLSGRLYIDFTEEDNFHSSIEHLTYEIYGLKKKQKPKLGENPFMGKPKNTSPISSAREFFAERFTHTFPGTRGIKWFETKEAIERLKLLFKEPITFDNYKPIWWWRGLANLEIKSFSILSSNTILLNNQEMIISKIAAVNTGRDYQDFVYIEVTPSDSSGLYTGYDCKETIKEWGYCWEEFGIFEGHFITRAEYDDGAAFIDGKNEVLNSNAEIRVRFLSKYNLIIAPHDSSINNKDFDLKCNEILNDIITGKESLENLVEEIKKLPKRFNRVRLD